MSGPIERVRQRARLLASIRAFFAARGVLEVTTPVLAAGVGTDPAIEPFVTRYQGPGGERTCYLQTSPEFHMKRLLAAGSGDIYQIMPVFRQGEVGRRHNPEFQLLEWYRLGFDHHRLMEEVAELVDQALERTLPVEKCTYRELFQEHFGWDPLTAEPAQMEASARRHGLQVAGSMTKDQWLDLLMATVVEPTLGHGRLCFVHGYPASQAALARLDPQDPRLACRFELYLEGVELANGFHELADADEQRARFEADNAARRAAGQEELPLDERFLQALASGLPDCAGVALGLDRLLMLRLGASDLAQVLSFAFFDA